MTPGDRMRETAELIRLKCLSCHYGRNEGRTVCYHSQHPGVMGGLGSEWALTCKDYYRKKERSKK